MEVTDEFKHFVVNPREQEVSADLKLGRCLRLAFWDNLQCYS